MKLNHYTSLLFLFSFVCQISAQDNCNTAVALDLNNQCLISTFDNTSSTSSGELPSPTCGSASDPQDVWFVVEVPDSGVFTAETQFITGGLFDMVLQAYSGSCGNLELIECDDDDGVGNHSFLQISNQPAGSLVYLRAFDFGSNAVGEFGICAVEIIAGSDGQLCSSAIDLDVQDSCNPIEFQNFVGSASGVSEGCISTIDIDLWFRIVVPASGNIIIETSEAVNSPNPFFDSIMQLYSGNCSSLLPIECNDDAIGLFSRIVVNRTPGEELFLRVSEFGGDPGDFAICVFEPTIGAGNICADAITLDVTENCQEQSFSNEFVTDSGVPLSGQCDDTTNAPSDIWFRAVVPASGNIVFVVQSAIGGLFSTIAEAYVGTCGDLNFLSCGEGAGFFSHPHFELENLMPGTEIFFRVYDPGNNTFGEFLVCIYDPVFEEGDICEMAQMLPVSDQCNPEVILNTDGYFGFNDNSCVETGQVDYWLQVEVPASGNLIIETLLSGTLDEVFSTEMQLFRGSCNNLEPVRCDDFSGEGSLSYIALIDSNHGETLFVQVSEQVGAPSDFGICAYEPNYADGDICGSAIILEARQTCNPQTFSTEGYERSAIMPDFSCFVDEALIDIWFQAVIPPSGALQLEISGVTGGINGTVVQTYFGSCDDLDAFFCDNPVTNDAHPTVNLAGIPGETVFFRVAGPTHNESGEFNVCLTERERSAGDVCNTAIQISPLQTCEGRTFTNEGFSNSNEAFDFICGLEGNGIDNWFWTRIPPSGNVVLQVESSDQNVLFDMVMQVYAGDCDNGFEILDCNDDTNGSQPEIEITGREPGEIIFFEILEFGNNSFGNFDVCAIDASAVDNDGDGFSVSDDCDDNNPDVNPLAVEIPGNDIDEDCDGSDLSATHELADRVINIYPNPTSGLVIIDTEQSQGLQMLIHSIEGKLMMNAKVKRELNLSNLDNGIYVLTIVDHANNKRIFEKIVLNK